MEKMVFQCTLLSGGFFAPYLGFRLLPKSLEASHHGGQGLFEPRLSHLFEFRNFLPLDRSQ